MGEQQLRDLYGCPECGRVASVPEWCKRPVCVHAWEGNGPEIWDGDDVDGNGRLIEESPHEPFRVPGPDTWAVMERIPVIPTSAVEEGLRAVHEKARQAGEQMALYTFAEFRDDFYAALQLKGVE